MPWDILDTTSFKKSYYRPAPYPSIPSIYHILDRDPNRLVMYSYDGSPLFSNVKTAQNKDACYNSTFDLGAVRQACSSYGLAFSQHMTTTPGLRAARILGCRPKEATAYTDDKRKSWKEGFLKNDIVIGEVYKDDETIQMAINEAEKKIKNKKDNLKTAMDDFCNANYGQQIKDLKKT